MKLKRIPLAYVIATNFSNEDQPYPGAVFADALGAGASAGDTNSAYPGINPPQVIVSS